MKLIPITMTRKIDIEHMLSNIDEVIYNECDCEVFTKLTKESWNDIYKIIIKELNDKIKENEREVV